MTSIGKMVSGILVSSLYDASLHITLVRFILAKVNTDGLIAFKMQPYSVAFPHAFK